MPPISWTSKWRWPSVRFARFAHRGEGFDQQVVERLARGEPRLEVGGARAQSLVRQPGDRRLQRVDLVDQRLETFDETIVCGTKQSPGEGADHQDLEAMARQGGWSVALGRATGER